MQEPTQPPQGGKQTPPASLHIINIIHEESELVLPFIHALGLVYASKGEIEVVDVRRGGRNNDSVSIRQVLEKWGALPPGSAREDVGKLGIRVKKIIKEGNFKKEVGKRLSKGYHDICVIGVRKHRGLGRFFGQDLNDFLIQSFRQTTLYIPSDTKSFIEESTGAIRLKKILVPVSVDPPPDSSFHTLQKIARLIPQQPPEVIGLHVGEIFPYISPALLEGLPWREIICAEDVVRSIIAVAGKEAADLIVMTTNGRSTFSEKFIGSITEQVLAGAPCPVLAVASV